ncbi:hypothetical protein BD414DRAFT_481948 [Trametes punicea]|nr:hypothetical protein BD414DRAFT_481948 [Trametes punicea]
MGLLTFSCSLRAVVNIRLPLKTSPGPVAIQARLISSSPYGRTHVWKRRQKKLPNPTVPVFPQRLVRVDGSTIIHYTTSPRSTIRLTRDTTNNPLWNAARFVGMDEEEDEVTGRMGRFSRRFGELGGQRSAMDWISQAAEEEVKAPAGDAPKAK